MDRLKGLICRSDSISEWSGGICAWLAVPLAGFTAYDVIMRLYLFQAPTKWAYEMTWMQ